MRSVSEVKLEGPEAADLAVYFYLTWLQEQFVAAAQEASR
jgi:hypothetical protein